MILWVIIGLVILIGLAWIASYNDLIKKRNWVEEAFSQIDVQLQRRNDLIPNLVNTVKGYVEHESSTLEAVTQARQQLIQVASQGDVERINELSNQLTGALSRLLAVAEQYPDLKANTNFIKLQDTLESIEKQIAVARQLYNSSATEYNIAIQSVPKNIVANIHHFDRKALLEAPEEARQVPEVQF
ncbi:LemA family protein [Hutsoniella sourekii]